MSPFLFLFLLGCGLILLAPQTPVLTQALGFQCARMPLSLRVESFGMRCVQVRRLSASSGVRANETSNFEIGLLDAKALGQAKAILDDGSNYYGSITRDGLFKMCVARAVGHPTILTRLRRPDVPEGTYILNIVARNHLFDQASVTAPGEFQS
jgi:hypothetical protein